MEESNKYDLSQMIKVNINSENYIDSVLPLIQCGEKDTSVIFLLQTCNLCLILKKHQTNPSERVYTEYLTSTSQNSQGHRNK